MSVDRDFLAANFPEVDPEMVDALEIEPATLCVDFHQQQGNKYIWKNNKETSCCVWVNNLGPNGEITSRLRANIGPGNTVTITDRQSLSSC